MLPSAQQKPPLPFDDIPHLPPFAEKLCPPHLFHCFVSVLDDVEFVIYDPALRSPLLNAEPERFPHVDTGSFDAFALPASQLRAEILIQRLFLPVLPKPQRLA